MHESYKILLSLTHEGILLITQRNMDKTLIADIVDVPDKHCSHIISS